MISNNRVAAFGSLAHLCSLISVFNDALPTPKTILGRMIEDNKIINEEFGLEGKKN